MLEHDLGDLVIAKTDVEGWWEQHSKLFEMYLSPVSYKVFGLSSSMYLLKSFGGRPEYILTHLLPLFPHPLSYQCFI